MKTGTLCNSALNEVFDGELEMPARATDARG